MIPNAGRKVVLLVLCLALAASGCASYHRINPEELAKLDGFVYGDEMIINDIGGEEIRFTEETPLSLVTGSDEPVRFYFATIDVDGSTFYGQTFDSRIVKMDLAEIDEVYVWKMGPRSTINRIALEVVEGIGTVVIETVALGVRIFVLLLLLLLGAGSGGGLA